MRLALAVSCLLAVQAGFAFDCASLKETRLEHTSIVVAESVTGGKFTPPYGPAFAKVPAFCRVAGVITPTPRSKIRFEVWLSDIGWNGKYKGVGNGGFAGSIDFPSMLGNINRGYATAATDTGHEGNGEDATWAYHNPEAIIDFGYRALHLTTVNAKALLQAFYSRAPQHSYFDSCSDGGREALMEAQRYPEDFDGILAGAPAYAWTHLVSGGVDLAKMMIGDPAGYISATKLPAIASAALQACDALDGVNDGLVSDPEKCHFDPSVLRCQGLETRSCLTDPQLATLKRIYSGPQGESGFVPGGENGWGDWLIGQGPGGSYASVYLENYMRYMVYGDPTFNVLTADPAEALGMSEQKTGQALNATDTDLHRFQARGGKLILYHGWNDPAIPPGGTIRYYQGVQAKMGAIATSFVRLYMVSGMQHCYGGPGPSAFGQLGIPTAEAPNFGIYDALEQWVETGKQPGMLVATKYAGVSPAGKVLMTRPICPYPQVPGLKTGGNRSEASGFSCGVTK